MYTHNGEFKFERDEILLPNTWIVVRIDGRGFHKLSNEYNFIKPNDRRAIDLMNAAAISVFKAVPDITIGYGISDEYSFILHKSTSLFDRRASKITSTILHEDKLPTFDGRAVCYPSIGNLRDYLAWRQVDCHINNLYNTTFWALVKSGISNVEAENLLKGTYASDKNEILFTRFGINYNDEEEVYRKGSVVFREYSVVHSGHGPESTIQLNTEVPETISRTQMEKARKAKQKAKIVIAHLDIIKDDFWNQRPWILSGKPGY